MLFLFLSHFLLLQFGVFVVSHQLFDRSDYSLRIGHGVRHRDMQKVSKKKQPAFVRSFVRSFDRMALCQTKRRYVKRRPHNKSSCWRSPITAFFLTFVVLASLRLRVPARSKQAASTLLTKSLKWQKQRRRQKIEKLLMESTRNEIRYELQPAEGSSPKVQRYVALDTSGEPVTTQLWARSIATDATKAFSMIEVIRDCGFPAVFFETPPVNSSTMSTKPFEFVLMDAPSLYDRAHGKMDFKTFEAFFNKEEAAVVFNNLGGDAILVSPNPIDNNKGDVLLNESFAHLASFVRVAPDVIVRETWKIMAEAYLDRVEEVKDEPVWLSTDGRGVSWLHFRLDERPKYYKYAAYRDV